MQKDIEALTKKGAAPEGLPVESPKPSKPDKPKSTIPAPSKKYGPYYILGKAFSRQAIISVIFIAIILLIAGGVYYWWNYMREPVTPSPTSHEPETPVFLVGADEIEVIESDSFVSTTILDDGKGWDVSIFVHQVCDSKGKDRIDLG